MLTQSAKFSITFSINIFTTSKAKIICNNKDYAQNEEKNKNNSVLDTHSNPKEPYANISNPRH